MYKTKKEKILIIVALIVGIVSLSVGFAAFSTTLNISSSASVNPNSDNFKVKFSTSQNSLVVGSVTPSSNSSGLTASNGTINNTTSPTLSNLSATFTSPGQYVEYTVYARNEGEYTAYLNSVNFIGEKTCEAVGNTTGSLVNAACNSINVVVYVGDNEYRETTEISNHTLARKSSEQIRIRIEYASNGTSVDGDFRITFNDIMLVYSTVDDSTYMPEVGGEIDIKSLYSKTKTLALSTDERIDFAYSGWDGNSGVFIRKGTENDPNPIYYYRGEVDNNHVLFANKCWLIVRTTETGGTKIVYNGVPTVDNKCGVNTELDLSTVYSSNYESVDGVSYINNDGSDSTVKAAVDQWYKDNLFAVYDQWIEDTVWCNDRSTTYSKITGNSWTDYVLFAPYSRIVDIHQPSYDCPSEYSLMVDAIEPTREMDYPIGLLTIDELAFAGAGGSNSTTNNYLYNNDYWWTMSPYNFENANARVFCFSGSYVSNSSVRSSMKIRPVISLAKGATVLSGDGSADLPYVIE